MLCARGTAWDAWTSPLLLKSIHELINFALQFFGISGILLGVGMAGGFIKEDGVR